MRLKKRQKLEKYKYYIRNASYFVTVNYFYNKMKIVFYKCYAYSYVSCIYGINLINLYSWTKKTI